MFPDAHLFGLSDRDSKLQIYNEAKIKIDGSPFAAHITNEEPVPDRYTSNFERVHEGYR